MEAGVGDGDTSDRQSAHSGRQERVCDHMSKDVGGEQHEEELVEDSQSEMTPVPQRQIHNSKIGIEISSEKVLGEMEDMANHHVFDEVPEGNAVGKHPRKVAERRHEDCCPTGAATAQSGTNAGLQSGDWIEGPMTCLGYPRHPNCILPRASGMSHSTRSL